MKTHSLSFCDITELENNIFEVVVHEGVNPNKNVRLFNMKPPALDWFSE